MGGECGSTKIDRIQKQSSKLLHITNELHDPLVSLNFEGNDPQNLFFTFFNSYEGGHCVPIHRKSRENPDI